MKISFLRTVVCYKFRLAMWPSSGFENTKVG